MKSFYEKLDYTMDDVMSLITDQVEESIYLDFKDARALDKGEKKRIDLSKDVASFANSDGGIIVYGIKEDNHVASEISFIDGNEFTKEWLEQVINSSVQRHISGINIYPIRDNGDISKTIYIVKIPLSYDAPHLSKDNRYYKRYNFMSVPMEEYEVRQSYNRKDKTELIIEDIIVTQGRSGVLSSTFLESVEYTVTFQIMNTSNSIENQYKLEVYMPSLYVKIDAMFRFHIRDEGKFSVFSIPNNSPVYQGEMTSVISASIELNSATKTLLSEPITVNLYYSNGMKTRVFTLANTFIFRGKSLDE